MRSSYKVFLGWVGALSLALAGLPAFGQQGVGGPVGGQDGGTNRSGGPETPGATPGQIEVSPDQTIPNRENPNVSPRESSPNPDTAPGVRPSSMESTMTLSEILRNSTSFSLLNSLISAVGATDESFSKPFAESGDLTVLAPTDRAFAALPEGTIRVLVQPENRDLLVQILENHVVEGDSAVALRRAGGIGAASSQIPASNGRIVPINQVLFPPDVMTELQNRVSMMQSVSPTAVGAGGPLPDGPGTLR